MILRRRSCRPPDRRECRRFPVRRSSEIERYAIFPEDAGRDRRIDFARRRDLEDLAAQDPVQAARVSGRQVGRRKRRGGVEMRRILVGLDGSPHQNDVLRAAIASGTGDSKLILMRAVSIPVELPPRMLTVAPDAVGRYLLDTARGDLELLAKTVPAALLDGVRVEIGTPWRTLIEAARKHRPSFSSSGPTATAVSTDCLARPLPKWSTTPRARCWSSAEAQSRQPQNIPGPNASTGQGALDTTACVTLPATNAVTPSRPWVPSTIRSCFSSTATQTIVAPGSPTLRR